MMIRKLGQRSIAVRGDVSRKDDVDAMVARVELELGGIDILVNNAGILLFEPFLTMSEANWDRVIDINLKGQFLVAQAVARGMARRGKGGRILNLASIASGQVGIGYPNIAHYCASKGGVNAMTEVMALELGPHRISVNAIAPGIIGTDMTKDLTADARAKRPSWHASPKAASAGPRMWQRSPSSLPPTRQTTAPAQPSMSTEAGWPDRNIPWSG